MKREFNSVIDKLEKQFEVKLAEVQSRFELNEVKISGLADPNEVKEHVQQVVNHERKRVHTLLEPIVRDIDLLF